MHPTVSARLQHMSIRWLAITLVVFLSILVPALSTPIARAATPPVNFHQIDAGDPEHLPILIYRQRHSTGEKPEVSWNRNVAAVEFPGVVYGKSLIIVAPNLDRFRGPSHPDVALIDLFLFDPKSFTYELVDINLRPIKPIKPTGADGPSWRGPPSYEWDVSKEDPATVAKLRGGQMHSERVTSLFAAKIGTISSNPLVKNLVNRPAKLASEMVPCGDSSPSRCEQNLKSGQFLPNLEQVVYVTEAPSQAKIINEARKAKKNKTTSPLAGKDSSATVLKGIQKDWEKTNFRLAPNTAKYIRAVSQDPQIAEAQQKQQEMLGQTDTDCQENTSAAGRPGSVSDQAMALAAWSASDCTGEEEGAGAPGALASALATSNLGGVDFSTLQMRYMSDSPGSGGLQYSLSGQRAGSGAKQNVDSALDVFTNNAADLRTWLVLAPSEFWVNLNPSEPDRIIDPLMGETDAGKAMLQADLQLKTTSAKLLDPRTSLGAEYWKELEGSSSEVCYGSRMWIVPGDVQVREDGGSLYVLKAKLAVKAVPEHVADGNPSCHYDPAVDARGQQLDNTLVVPRITQAVNSAPEYAAIRRAFMARIVAQWIRDRYDHGEHTSFDKLIDTANVGPAKLQDGWTPQQVYDSYVHELKGGAFTYKTTSRQGQYIVTQNVTVGGVDFTDLHPTVVSAAQMNTLDPNLPKTVQASTRNPASGPDGSIWLGDTLTPPVKSHASGASSGGGLSGGWIALLVLIAIVLGSFVTGVFRSLRKRRASRAG